MLMADLDVQAGRFQDAAAHLREGLQIAMQAGEWWDVAYNGLWYCGCCAPRPDATPTPPRCGPPRISTTGSRDSRAGRPGTREGGSNR